ncbi:MAG: RidA family protein [Candidatus Competibacteraceae bacterium]|nr:RidA family protein [Candidatus Competibacteraceae bacterium]
MNIERLGIGPRMSRIVIYNDTIYLCGQTAGSGGTVAEQTREILAGIDAELARVGSDKSKVLSVTIYLTDMADFAAMNQVWDAWVDPAAPPARATVEARLARPQLAVEMTVIAAR